MNRIAFIIFISLFINQSVFSQDSLEIDVITDSLNFTIDVNYNNEEFGPGYKAEIKTEGGKIFCYYNKHDIKGKKTKVFKKEVNDDFVKEVKERINYRIKTDPDNCRTKTIVKVSHIDKTLEFSFSDCEDVSFDDDFFKLK
jgi:uncharacterized secreted protein with C-terminal beta-propeller domain